MATHDTFLGETPSLAGEALRSQLTQKHAELCTLEHEVAQGIERLPIVRRELRLLCEQADERSLAFVMPLDEIRYIGNTVTSYFDRRWD